MNIIREERNCWSIFLQLGNKTLGSLGMFSTEVLLRRDAKVRSTELKKHFELIYCLVESFLVAKCRKLMILFFSVSIKVQVKVPGIRPICYVLRSLQFHGATHEIRGCIPAGTTLGKARTNYDHTEACSTRVRAFFGREHEDQDRKTQEFFSLLNQKAQRFFAPF